MSKLLIFSDLHGGIDLHHNSGKIKTHGSQWMSLLEGVRKLAIAERVDGIIDKGDLASGNNPREFLRNYLIINRVLCKIFPGLMVNMFGNHEEGKLLDLPKGARELMNGGSFVKKVVGDVNMIFLDLEFGKKSGRASGC